jgi:hypothetical protein
MQVASTGMPVDAPGSLGLVMRLLLNLTVDFKSFQLCP